MATDPELMLSSGWMGRWSPGIGDPTLGGWLAVASYLLAAWLCFTAWRRLAAQGLSNDLREARGYAFLAITLLFLGINKQLDLQTAFTELGRILAHQQGWYSDRQRVQLAFMAALAIAGVTVAVMVLLFTWRLSVPTRMVWVAWLGLGVFVVLRAASFHHMDRFIGTSALGVVWNHWLELGCLWVIAACVISRLWQLKTNWE